MTNDPQNPVETRVENAEPVDESVASPLAEPKGSGSSVLKLVGIGVGLVFVAAIIVAVVFQQTLSESNNRRSKVVEIGSAEDLAAYDAYAGGGPEVPPDDTDASPTDVSAPEPPQPEATGSP